MSMMDIIKNGSSTSSIKPKKGIFPKIYHKASSQMKTKMNMKSH